MPFITDRLESLQKQQEDISLKETNKEQLVNELPQKSFVSRFSYQLQEVMTFLKANIIGQDEALRSIEKILKVVKAELNDSQRPLAVALLLGPTGVGKTSTAKLLAQALSKNEDNFCRIDMNTLAQEHYTASLIGAPPGYVGSKEGNTLFSAQNIAGTYSVPSVVLFDEIEKANQNVLLSLLEVLDSGELTLTSGVKKISFRNAIIIMTSNIGAREVFSYRKKHGNLNYRKEKKIVKKKVEENFLPEFINRIDHILYYQSIDKTQLEQIINLELRTLKSRGLGDIIISQKVMKELITSYNFVYGVRDIKRMFYNDILPLIADRILNNEQVSIIDLQDCKFVIR